MMNFYQHLPEKIDPIALHIGSFSIRWYSIAYLVGFIVVCTLLIWRIKYDVNTGKFQISNFKFQNNDQNQNFKNIIFDLLIFIFVGALIGGRLGYVLFYNFSYYISHPIAIISPFDSAGNLVGIYGMSYFGGLIGAILAGYIFCRKRKIVFFEMANSIIPAIPAGYFFGRLGNFLNGELYGRTTEVPWGMYFADGILRHPSQLYEAFFEGLVIFVVLWSLRNKRFVIARESESRLETTVAIPSLVRKLRDCFASLTMTRNGGLLTTYLFLYGFFRFFIEFFREPDMPTSGLTTGQMLSLILIIISAFLYFHNYKKKDKI